MTMNELTHVIYDNTPPCVHRHVGTDSPAAGLTLVTTA